MEPEEIQKRTYVKKIKNLPKIQSSIKFNIMFNSIFFIIYLK